MELNSQAALLAAAQVPAGTSVRLPPSGLALRAIEFLAEGPANSVSLVSHVCQLPGVPPLVAEHMAAALLAALPDFGRLDDGRWHTVARHVEQCEMALDDRRTTSASEELIVVPLSTLAYAVVDVETTGGCAWRGDRITEIAAVIVRGGQVVERFESLVNPERPIPPMISALTNISWSMVRDAPRFRDVCERVVGMMSGRIFVGHNADFDWRFVSAEVQRATGHRLEGERLCTVRLARKLLPHLRSRRLDSVAHHYGVDITARHRAGGDALATAHVLLKLLADARGQECENWHELQRLLGRDRGKRGRRRRSALPGPVDVDTTS
ncbi:MAG: 3'-5' exonuclease [Anaerolineae bacterium]|nr:3'-5' exonuclease [Gemmatimonadaceae bacterium]